MTEQRNDEFPDQLFLNHVRDALWRRPGKASVMVGSAFSRMPENQADFVLRKEIPWVD